jgi:hypothetical protein
MYSFTSSHAYTIADPPPLRPFLGLDAIQRVVERVRAAEKEGKDLHEEFGRDLKK